MIHGISNLRRNSACIFFFAQRSLYVFPVAWTPLESTRGGREKKIYNLFNWKQWGKLFLGHCWPSRHRGEFDNKEANKRVAINGLHQDKVNKRGEKWTIVIDVTIDFKLQCIIPQYGPTLLLRLDVDAP